MQSELSDIVRFHGAPALLAGAGISIDAPSNLLSGGDMMKGIIEKAVLSNDASHFLNLLHPPLFSSHNPGGYLRFELLIHRLRKYDPHLEVFKCLKDCQSPNLNHYLLARLLHENHTVVTTNFDNLIERAYDNLKTPTSKPLSTIAYNTEFQRPLSARCLWKLHGSFTREGKDISDSIQAEFTKVLTNAQSGKKHFLEAVVSSQDIVVVGYSGSDDLDIIPILSNTPSNKKILWVKHGSVLKDVTESVSQESKRIKSQYHALGLHKLMYEKGRDFIKVIEAPTNAILASFVPRSEVAKFRALTKGEVAYRFSERYFEEWAERVKWTELRKRSFTRTLFQDVTFNPEWDFPPQETKPTASIKSSEVGHNLSVKSPELKVMLLVGEFNSRGYNVNANLEQWLKELVEIERSIDEMQVPSLYNIKGCIQCELGQGKEAAKSFYKALIYYEGSHDLENAFWILEALDSRYLLDDNGKGKMYEALKSTGFYPVIWKRIFEQYSSILSPIHSYAAFVSETGEHLLEYDQAVRDLLRMKGYSIVMGDVNGERNIDRLLWKLDYYEEGIARDFDE